MPDVVSRPISIVRPRSVTAAFILLLAAALVHAVGATVNLMAMLSRLQAVATVTAPAGRASAVLTTMMLGNLIGSLLVLAVWLSLVILMRIGRGWARIAVTVLGSLDLGLVAVAIRHIDVTRPAPTAASLPLASLGIVVLIVGVVLMFTPTSNTYFRAHRLGRGRTIE